MADGLSTRAYQFSIVALGSMNPRLHHPLWYRIIGAITEEEEALATASPNLVVIPPLARFEVAGITIACQENRWEISATQPALRTRIRDVAALVFKKLYETPIQTYGLNNNFEIETGIAKVSKCLGDLFLSLDLGPKAEGEPTSTLNFLDVQKGRRIQVALGPSSLSQDVLTFA